MDVAVEARLCFLIRPLAGINRRIETLMWDNFERLDALMQKRRKTKPLRYFSGIGSFLLYPLELGRNE